MDGINEIFDNYRDIQYVREVRDIHKYPKIYSNRINPLLEYNDRKFKRIYRFKKQTLRRVIESVRVDLETYNNRDLPVSPEIQVLSTIRYLAKGNYQSEAAQIHGFSQATMSRICSRVVRAIASKINQHIYFPGNERQIFDIKEGFYNIAHMPNIIGAIDGTHIKIKNPGKNSLLYMNRKGYYSLNVQVICDSTTKIRDIVARWRGSARDSRIWNNCRFKELMEAREINGSLLGDNGYPNSQLILTPMLQPTTPAHQRYNSAHIKTRNVVQRLFGQWKNKFRCFFNGMQMSLETAKAAIIALAVLHNISVEDREDDASDEENDDENINEENNEDEDVDQNVYEGRNAFRTNYIANHFN